jgi:hypothetical protein
MYSRRGRLIRPNRASCEQDPQATASPARLAFLTAFKKPFFKSVLSRDVAFGVKRTRHQFAPAMPGQKLDTSINWLRQQDEQAHPVFLFGEDMLNLGPDF